MTTLNAVLEATENPVVGEQHDLSRINWVRGMSDPGEMIRCGYLPQLRRLDGENDEQYYQRLVPLIAALHPDDRQKIEALGLDAAIKRAGLDTSNGRVNVMVAVGPDGERMPWHVLGVFVREAQESKSAMRLSGTDWTVEKVPATYSWRDATFASKETFLLIRQDTGKELGSVGNVYKPIQNSEGFAFVDDVLREHGARYETAGSIRGGRTVWLQALMPKVAEPQRGDVVQSYVFFTLSHDGTAANKCLPTTERVVCANTHRLALNSGVGKGISISHTGDIKKKIGAARDALGLAAAGFSEFGQQAEAMVAARLPLVPYANEVLDACLEVTQADCEKGADLLARAVAKTQADYDLRVKAFERQIVRRGQVLDDILERYETDRCKPAGSAWAAYNAVSEHADHYRAMKGPRDGRDDRRFENVLVGQGDTMKQVAFEKAVAVTAG